MANAAPDMIAQARHRYCIVEASAGTGKTYFLERKFIDLVVSDGAKVEQIVVVTFTEAATAELRGRIRTLLADMLDAATAAQDAVTAARLEEAYRNFDSAPISTIHGFCQRLLRKYQPGFGNDKSNADIKVIVAHAFPVVMRRLLASHPALATWVSHNGVESLRGLVTKACMAVLEGRKHAASDSELDNIIALVVPPLMQEIAEVKERSRWFEFQDLLQGAADLVKAPDGVIAAQVRESTPWALVDEFQDTDALQWDIFSSIWLHPGARGLTVVGDPKQSIYGFRGANIAVYHRACRALKAAGGVELPLVANYRSSSAVVEAYNRVFGAAFFSHLPYTVVTANADPELSLRSGDQPLTPFVVWDADDDWSVRRPQIKAAMVDEILWLCGRGGKDRPPAPLLHNAQGARALTFSDIMILAPRNGDLMELAQALRAADIPVSIRGRQSVYSTPEAGALCYLLAAICQPRDHSARLRALRTPFFPPASCYLLDDTDPCVGWITRWSAQARGGRFAEMFSDILATTRVIERLMIDDAGPRAVANVRHLIEDCLTHATTAHVTIQELAAYVARLCDDDDEAEGKHGLRMDLDGDAVRLMTCHKAKGLESPVVMVFSFQARAQSLRSVELFERDEQQWFTLGKKDAGDASGKELAVRSYKEERERLAYVALSRAKVRNYVLGPRHSKGGEVAADDLYQPIWRGLGAAGLTPLQCQVVSLPTVAEAPALVAAADQAQTALLAASLPLPQPLGAADALAWTPPQRGIKVVSYSSLKWNDGAPVVTETGREFADESPSEVLLAGEAAMEVGGIETQGPVLPPGRESGLFLHKLLELAPMPRAQDDAATWGASDAFTRAMHIAAGEYGIDSAYVAYATSVAFAAFTTPLPLRDGQAPLASATRFARELAFMAPIFAPSSEASRGAAPALGDTLVGVIDALCEINGRLWVIDYKSDALPSGDLATAARHVTAHYNWQKMIYTIAVLRVARITSEADYALRFGGVGFLFLRTGQCVAEVPAWADVQQWQRKLAQRLGALS